MIRFLCIILLLITLIEVNSYSNDGYWNDYHPTLLTHKRLPSKTRHFTPKRFSWRGKNHRKRFKFPIRKSKRRSQYIVGGLQSREGQFPYIISLRMPWSMDSHTCGGALIHEKFALTAAHCTVVRLSKGGIAIRQNLEFVIGTIHSDQGGDRYKVANVTPHPQFEPSTHKNDISILHVEKAVTLGPMVQTIPLFHEDLPEKAEVVICGWGRIGARKKQSTELLYYNSKVISSDTCIPRRVQDDYVVWEGNFCTYSDVGIGTCMGDSGGPLVYENQLAGLTSFGTPCAKGEPDVFTRVSKYVPWIEEVMNESPPEEIEVESTTIISENSTEEE